MEWHLYHDTENCYKIGTLCRNKAWGEVNLCKVFLSFVYICIAFRNPIIKRRRVGIPLIDLTLPHVCTYTKSGFPTSYVVVYFYIQWLRWEVIARGIAVYHCLRFLYIITFNQEQQAMLWCLYISYLLIFFLIESMIMEPFLIKNFGNISFRD
jgi:hypothetical protein